jgi:hypothetical protein
LEIVPKNKAFSILATVLIKSAVIAVVVLGRLTPFGYLAAAYFPR